MSKRNIIIGLAVLVIAIIVAGVAWNRHQTKQLQETTLSQIDNATRALRSAMALPPSTNAAEHARVVSAGTARVDQDLAALRDTNTSRVLLLAAGADGYLLTARELLRRQATMLQLRTRISDGIIAFRTHLTTGSRAAADWTTEAVRLKNKLEQDYREFQRAVDAHTTIADGFPDARKALAPLAPEDRLIAAAEIAAMREAALTAASALSGEINAVRQLAAPR